MQEIDFALNTVFILAFFTLYGTVTWGLFRYSTKQSYRYWALGWVIYSVGGLQAGFSSFAGLVPIDLFGLVCIYVGSRLILDGSWDIELTRRRVASYVVGAIAFLVGGILSILFHIEFYIIFSIIGLYVAYACLHSARTVHRVKDVTDMSKAWLMAGLIVWAISWIIFPLVAVIPGFYYYVITIQASGVIITGASMLSLFIGTVTRNLEQQYQVSQIMFSLIQHDIRNYIQVARSALELTEGASLIEDYWVGIASESLDDASNFINEMRDITALLARQGSTSVLTSLPPIIDEILNRVVQEYSLRPEQIQVQVSGERLIRSCPLLKEILWNIFDNAFKHGSIELVVREVSTRSNVVLEISDRSGGLSEEIKEFLNSPDSLSKPVAPGFGLGIVLIRGLSIICGINLQVEDIIEDSRVIGTQFTLLFTT
jgi:signal transduction histidine kinase